MLGHSRCNRARDRCRGWGVRSIPRWGEDCGGRPGRESRATFSISQSPSLRFAAPSTAKANMRISWQESLTVHESCPSLRQKAIGIEPVSCDPFKS